MRYSSSNTKTAKACRHDNWRAVLAVATLGAAAPALSETTTCKMHNAAFIAGETTSRFTIDISCGAEGAAFPMNTDLIAGLTLYAHPKAADVDAETARTMDAPRSIGLVDAETDSHDVEAQVVAIQSEDASLTLEFEAPTADIADMRYMLFAVWKASAKTECDRESQYARSGCRKFGYEMVGVLADVLVAAYPGLEDYEYQDDDGLLKHVVQWNAELFQ